MAIAYSIITTEDDSHTVTIENTDISFHSTHGAIQESTHIFINDGLQYFIENHATAKNIKVFEVGFGTGLNALLAAKAAVQNKKNIEYHAIDAHPLPVEVYTALNYPIILNEMELYKTIMQTGWNQLLFMTPFFKLNKIKKDLQSYSFNNTFDVVFFDPFAPENEPELWSPPIFEKIYNAMNNGGVLTTYCSKSVVRKILEEVGFMVEKLNGPPGKREIIRATKRL